SVRKDRRAGRGDLLDFLGLILLVGERGIDPADVVVEGFGVGSAEAGREELILYAILGALEPHGFQSVDALHELFPGDRSFVARDGSEILPIDLRDLVLVIRLFRGVPRLLREEFLEPWLDEWIARASIDPIAHERELAQRSSLEICLADLTLVIERPRRVLAGKRASRRKCEDEANGQSDPKSKAHGATSISSGWRP